MVMLPPLQGQVYLRHIQTFGYLPTLLIVICLFFTACKKDPPPATSVSGCAVTNNLADHHPKATKYQALLDTYVQKGLPGVILLVQSPKDGLWVGAAGKANKETGESMTPCSLNYPQSIAKTFTATAMMLLVQDGRVNLDAKLPTYLPLSITRPITNGDQITVRQLLNHTSGVYNYVSDSAYQADLLKNLNNPARTYTTTDYLSYVAGKAASFAPGTSFRYSDTNYELAALVIDYVTGRSHAYLFTERIFRPLGLTHTYYKNEQGYPKPPGLVASYAELGNGQVNVSDAQNRSVSSFVGDDGLIASAEDLAIFIKALATGKIVTMASLQQMTQWINIGTSNSQYGLGLVHSTTPYGSILGHPGSGLGAGAQMYYLPDVDVTVIAFTNIGTFEEGPLPDLFNNTLLSDVLQLVGQ